MLSIMNEVDSCVVRCKTNFPTTSAPTYEMSHETAKQQVFLHKNFEILRKFFKTKVTTITSKNK